MVETAQEKDDHLESLPSAATTEPPHSPISDQADTCTCEQDLPVEQHNDRLDVQTLPSSPRLTELEGDAEAEKPLLEQESENKDKMETNGKGSPRQSPPPVSSDPVSVEGSQIHIDVGDNERSEGGGEGEEVKGSVCREEDGESSPTKLILSIPFYHVKLKRGHGRSPSEIMLCPFCWGTCTCAG